MRKLQAKTRHDVAKGMFSDVYRTAIACLLDMGRPEDVPHFHDGPITALLAQTLRMNSWLAAQGLRRVVVPYGEHASVPQILESMGNVNPSVMWLLVGGAESGEHNTAVICHGGQIVHKPGPDIALRVLPEQRYFLTEFLTPDFAGDWQG